MANGSSGDQRAAVQSYVNDWSTGRYAAMYRMLSPGSRNAISQSKFESALRHDADLATVTSMAPGKISSVSGSQAQVAYTVHTHVFGTLNETLQLSLDSSDSSHVRIRFTPASQFPGLTGNEQLSRKVLLAHRGSLIAANGQVLAAGSSLSTPIPQAAQQIAGTLGAIPKSERATYIREGYPANARVGTDGLEAAYQRQLAGKIGGVLYAGKHVLARTPAVNGQTIRTTIDPAMENAATAAIGAHLGGITVMKPNGQILAASGIAYSALQPPGSTFKIITSTAALQAGLTSLGKQYPYATSADVGGYIMNNAGGESCGGTLINAFATSCNSTFAPIGVQVGAQRLVSAAEKYGFNSPYAGIPTASEPTIPSASTIGGATAVGSSAIGQGKVQASTLTMADVAATIADGGKRPLPTFNASAKPAYAAVTSSKIAGEIQQMMIAVVQYGTGTTAQIPGVVVAGKTGTAELANTGSQQNNVKETDSWFVAYAPASHPKVIVCALFPGAGYGADTAGPAVKSVLESALGLG